MESEGAAEHR